MAGETEKEVAVNMAKKYTQEGREEAITLASLSVQKYKTGTRTDFPVGIRMPVFRFTQSNAEIYKYFISADHLNKSANPVFLLFRFQADQFIFRYKCRQAGLFFDDIADGARNGRLCIAAPIV